VGEPNLRAARQLFGHISREPRAAETFADCVHRLGPMVLGVCRRILGNAVEADDAFQATFLTVFRKWESVRDHRALAGWVHRIAVRVAVRVARRRPSIPVGPAPAVESRVVDELSWKEVRAVLDEELDRLPARLRSPLVLCYLDGLSREAAADRMGWSVRTLHRRLEEGRERLHAVLARRGLVGLALGCAALSAEGLRATVSPRLLEAATRLGAGPVPAGVVAAALPARAPWVGGLTVALAAVVVGFGGWWTRAADPKADRPKADDAPRAATTFEKRPFWWGSEAFRHDGWTLDSDLSADGQRLATAASSSFVVWELPTGKKLLHVVESEAVSYIGRDRISVVRLSPDGKQLATANKTTGDVCVWDVATGKRLATIAWDRDTEQEANKKTGLGAIEPRKHSVSYYLAIDYVDNTHIRIQSSCFTTSWDTVKNNRVGVEFHPPAADFGITKDRKCVLRSRQTATGKDGIQPALILWDVAAGKAVREFPLDGQPYDTIATLSGDQRFLAVTRNRGREIALWDWPANSEVGALEFVAEKEYDHVRTMEFGPDGKTLYVGSSFGNVIVYDPATKTKTRSWKACANNVMRIHFAPDGKTLYTTGGDGLVRTWRLPEGKEIPVPEGYIGRPVFCWSRARNAMVVGDEQGRIDLWDATGSRITRTLQTRGEPVVQLAFSRSGRLLAASDGKGWTRLWSLDNGEQLAKFGGAEESSGWLYNVLQISDDETRLLVRTGYSVRMYRIPEGKELWLAPPKQMAVFALSPNGKTVCASSFEGVATSLYDADTFQRPVPLEQVKDMEFPAYEARLTFSPDSRILALTTPKGKVLFFDGTTGKHLGTRATEDEELFSLGYTDDGAFLIALNHSKAFLFDAVKFDKLADVPFDVTARFQYGTATPGGVEALLALFRPKELPKADLEACWKKLDSPRPKDALEAIWQMSEAADLAPFLRTKIPPVTAPDAEVVRKLIDDLDSPRFAAREAAVRRLGELGRPAEPFLRAALRAKPSAEAAERLGRVLADLQRPPTPEEVRQRRVIFALETNGNAEARRTLEAWAAGAAGAHLTEQSKQALGRLGR
jgi:RNA polymerase sigma factor (sigma-70 family)